MIRHLYQLCVELGDICLFVYRLYRAIKVNC